MAKRERPILFSGPMVRAILEGRKTQTRRVVKPQPLSMREAESKGMHGDLVLDLASYSGVSRLSESRGRNAAAAGVLITHPHCPYGAPGDRLWVRETWWMHDNQNAFDAEDGNVTAPDGTRRLVGYAATMNYDSSRCASEFGCRKRPSIHMPRWASRLTLEVVAVRVERLQAISEEDVLAEGIERPLRREYAELWESINGAGSWDANPFVWVVEFRRLTNGEA